MDLTHFPDGFAQWATCGVFFIACFFWLANQALKFFKAVVPKPAHPPNEQLEASAMELIRRIGEIEKRAEGERDAGVRSRAMIYKKIDEVSEKLSGETASLRDDMHEKFEALPERIIKLIKALKEE